MKSLHLIWAVAVCLFSSLAVVSCSSGEVAVGGGGCPVGLVSCGASCVSTELNSEHCGECDASCPTGEVCSSGTCATECVGGTTKCEDGSGSASCVNTELDPSNCGACGTSCPSGQVCSAGQCGSECVGGTTKCGTQCVDTNLDPAHCGMCSSPCAQDEVCSMGSCGISCAGGTTYCSGKCVDTSTDNANCGTCGNACASGTACSGGSCQTTCGMGLTDCGGGICANLQSDNANCGMCANQCGAGSLCQAGSCNCFGGLTDCNGTCADLLDDANHCGTCGNACSGPCFKGSCAWPSCNALHIADPNLPNGVYSLDPDGMGGNAAFDAFCEMVADGGGWTLAMKTDGNAATFAYASLQWTDATPFNPQFPDFDLNEAKLASFASMGFTELRLGMTVANTTNFIVMPVVATSLLSIFQAGYTPSTIGRASWKSLINGSSLQTNCNMEGFNVICSGGTQVRIGMVDNQENDCTSCDSRIGFGGAGGNCGQDASNSCGNEARCSSDNGDVSIKAFGYVMLR